MIETAQMTVTEAEFEAQCRALMTIVDQTGASIVILRDGAPIARLGPPPPRRPPKTAFGFYKGLIGPIGEVDLDQPVVDPSEWTVLESEGDVHE